MFSNHIPVLCSNLADPANGRVSQGGNRPGDRASYFCDREYRLVGEPSRTCLGTGEWSGEAPTCERQGEQNAARAHALGPSHFKIMHLICTARCPTLSAPSNGRVDQQGNRPGDRAIYTCNSNYDLVGDPSRTCQNDGEWSGSAPTCARVTCPNLSNPANGQVTFSFGVSVGSTATYTCTSGYVIVGESTRVCQGDGSWSGRAPICSIVKCGGLSNPSNGQVSITNDTPGGTATYTCNSGYTLVGLETRTCQNNGEWSGSAPTCTRVTCPNLSNPTNGQVTFSSGVSVGSTATYTCTSGYVIIGVSTRVCQGDGSWSGRAPICRIVRCGGLSNPSNGQVSITNNTPGGTATYTCNSGYNLVGREIRICQNDGEWSGEAPICERQSRSLKYFMTSSYIHRMSVFGYSSLCYFVCSV